VFGVFTVAGHHDQKIVRLPDQLVVGLATVASLYLSSRRTGSAVVRRRLVSSAIMMRQTSLDRCRFRQRMAARGDAPAAILRS
ncbi:hypothetical protein, partial [Nocardia gipuzkoensis]|uniref:hypothetical protein n=1 Tax=Nocardia gipuzkoensis TaxID=2749991 RepID=UPI00237E5D91